MAKQIPIMKALEFGGAFVASYDGSMYVGRDLLWCRVEGKGKDLTYVSVMDQGTCQALQRSYQEESMKPLTNFVAAAIADLNKGVQA